MSNIRRALSMQSSASQPSGYRGLKFTSAGNTTVRLSKTGITIDIKYSLDNGLTWEQYDFTVITLLDGDTICFKGSNSIFSKDSTLRYANFVFGGNGMIYASGNIMSLLDDGVCEQLYIPNTCCFAKLFKDCTSLITAPELPATTLKNDCYGALFSNCTSLIAAPELPATTMSTSCYASMFENCTSLIAAPELPATKTSNMSYQKMFYGCSCLNYIKCLIKKKGRDSLKNWAYGVAASGTFVKNASTSISTITRGANGIPTGWTVQDA